MYIRKIVIALSMLVGFNLSAATCDIDLVSQNGDLYEYTVNGNNLIVENVNGIVNLLIAKDKSTTQTYRGVIKKNQVCLNLSQNCVDVYSDDIKEYMQLFLEGTFCLGEEK